MQLLPVTFGTNIIQYFQFVLWVRLRWIKKFTLPGLCDIACCPNINYMANKVKKTVNPATISYPYLGGYRTSDESHIGAVSVDSIISRHYYEQGAVLGISKISVEYFEKMVELTNEKEVKLYLICTPLHPGYIKRVPENIKHTFDSLAREAKTYDHVTFIDLSKEVKNDSLFTDYDHLNTRGAKLFSVKLNTLLNRE